MTLRCALACALLAACGGSSPGAAEPETTSLSSSSSAAAPPACVELPADADAPKGEFVLARGYRDFRVYRIVAADCATLVATIDPGGGPLAFVYLGEAQRDGMPEISVETWLMHGDRRSQRYTWLGSYYAETGRAEEIPGPRR